MRCSFSASAVEDMKQWVKGKPLGAGAFGTVRQYYNKENGVERAVKEVQMTERTPERVSQFNRPKTRKAYW